MKKVFITIIAMLLPIILIAGSGDVNGDGKINVADIVELLNHINGKPTQNYHASEADANNDGVVDLNDASAIADKIMAVKIAGKVSLPSNVDNSFLQSCKIVGISDEFPIQGNNFQVLAIPNGLVQTYFLCDNNEKTFMACRVSEINDNSEIAINVESTAIALATLHPLFAPINGKDYNTLIWNIKSSPKYLAYYYEVENVIKGKKDLFSDTNEALINSLEVLYDDVLSDIDFDAYQNASAISLSRVNTRGIRERLDPTYFAYNLNGNTLTLQSRGLTPSYYGTVTSAMTGEIRDYVLRCRSDYGGMDMFLPYDQVNLGPQCSYIFSSEGEHLFNLSRTNVAATIDFYMRLANSLLDIIGLDFGDDTLIQGIASNISDAMLDAGMNVAESAVLGDDVSFSEWFGVAYDATINYLRRDTNIFARSGLFCNLTNFARILSNAWNVYNRIKGAINIGSRLAYALNAPETIDFCLCYYKGKIYDCVDASISIVSGNGQKGKSQELLEEPLKVSVKTIDRDGIEQAPSPFLVVKFEVFSGEGFVKSENVSSCKVYVGSDKTAQTQWILGERGVQRVKAVIYNSITEEEIGTPVFFTASLKKEKDDEDEEDDEDDEEDNLYSTVTCPNNSHPHWIDLGLPSGTLWSCCNIGASKPEGCGSLFYWDNALKYNPPSLNQFHELHQNCQIEMKLRNGVRGCELKGPSGGSIFLPINGRLATYWTSTWGYWLPGFEYQNALAIQILYEECVFSVFSHLYCAEWDDYYVRSVY